MSGNKVIVKPGRVLLPEITFHAALYRECYRISTPGLLYCTESSNCQTHLARYMISVQGYFGQIMAVFQR